MDRNRLAGPDDADRPVPARSGEFADYFRQQDAKAEEALNRALVGGIISGTVGATGFSPWPGRPWAQRFSRGVGLLNTGIAGTEAWTALQALLDRDQAQRGIRMWGDTGMSGPLPEYKQPSGIDWRGSFEAPRANPQGARDDQSMERAWWEDIQRRTKGGEPVSQTPPWVK